MTICTPWRVANSLNKLLDQVNALAPSRDKASDGSIGDAAHQSEACSSQHNSCCIQFNGIWIIRARDFTHDPAGGFDSYAFAEQLRLSRDPRIRYVISNHRITGPNHNWQWDAYDGSDPHTNHAHVSVVDTQSLYDSTAAWRITTPSSTPTAASAGKGGSTVLYMTPDGAVYNENGVHINGSEASSPSTKNWASAVVLAVPSVARVTQLTTPSVTVPAPDIDTAALAAAIAAQLPNVSEQQVLDALQSEDGQAALVQAANIAEDS
jgi:hypothetical protein